MNTMNTMNTNSLLTPAALWNGKIHSQGWQAGGLGSADVTDKATGETFGQIGVASPADVANAAALARTAQREWAQVPAHCAVTFCASIPADFTQCR